MFIHFTNVHGGNSFEVERLIKLMRHLINVIELQFLFMYCESW